MQRPNNVGMFCSRVKSAKICDLQPFACSSIDSSVNGKRHGNTYPLKTVTKLQEPTLLAQPATVHAKSHTSQPISASNTSSYVLTSAFVTIILGECHQMNFKNLFLQKFTCEHFCDSIDCGSVKILPCEKYLLYRTDCYMLCTCTYKSREITF